MRAACRIVGKSHLPRAISLIPLLSRARQPEARSDGCLAVKARLVLSNRKSQGRLSGVTVTVNKSP